MKNIEKSIEYNECMKIYKIFKSKYILKMCILKINKYKNLKININYPYKISKPFFLSNHSLSFFFPIITYINTLLLQGANNGETWKRKRSEKKRKETRERKKERKNGSL